jgi:hypothetical protein
MLSAPGILDFRIPICDGSERRRSRSGQDRGQFPPLSVELTQFCAEQMALADRLEPMRRFARFFVRDAEPKDAPRFDPSIANQKSKIANP